MDVYVAPEVAEVETLHPYLNSELFQALPIYEQIAIQADTIHSAHSAGDDRIKMHVMSWWPEARGQSIDKIMAIQFSYEDALATMSLEYGFLGWQEVEALGDASPDINFEQTLNEMLAGDLLKFKHQLELYPYLITAQSKYGHKATLLHYLGANGVECHRQKTPYNAIESAKLLIQFGADINAKANIYEGEQTAFMLSSTSKHPNEAGISRELNQVLSGKFA